MNFSAKFITFGRVLSTGSHNFIRNAWLSTAATAIMTVTLTLILATVILNKALGDTIQDIAKDITISVYLKDDASNDRIEELRKSMANSHEVKDIDYISKEEARSRYINREGYNQELIDAFQFVGNTLPASFEVELHDLSENKGIVGVINSEDYTDVVDEFDQNRLQTVNKIGSAQRIITNSGIIAAGIFAVISILVIFNTIRMAIFTRSDEIKIMRLIGATNGYIRGPFLFEAVLYGIVAGILAMMAVYSLLLTLGPKVEKHVYFTETIEFFSAYWPFVALSTVIAGTLIGAISSSLAMARYMSK